MTNRLPPLSSLRAFEAAARLSSFKQAAAELAVTATAISHRIRVLEADLGRPLFVRKVRAVALTADGQTLSAAVSGGFRTIATAIEQIRRPARASVTLSTTPAFAAKWLVPKLGAFHAAHPDIDLHVHASTLPTDLNTGTIDLAVRYGHGEYPATTATLLFQDWFAPLASPALLAASGSDPAGWPLIHFDWQRPMPVDLTWGAWARQAGLGARRLTAGVRYSEESHAIQAAISGQGVALLSVLLVEDELRWGLLQVAAEPTLRGMRYHVLRPTLRPVTEAALAVEAWLIDTAGKSPLAADRPFPRVTASTRGDERGQVVIPRLVKKRPRRRPR